MGRCLMPTRKVAAIWIGERDREPGDVTDLMASMTEVGLLHPVVITPDDHLVAGGRRLEAAKCLGWTEIDVTVISSLADAELALRAEMEENVCRRDLTPTEAAKARQRRAKELAPLAREAQARPGKPRSSKLDEHTGPTRKVAAQGTGYSGSTLDKVDHVAAVAADDRQPEPVREIAREALAAMDDSGKVDGAHRAVVIAEQKQAEDTLRAAIAKRLPDAAAEDAISSERLRISRLFAAASQIPTMSAANVAAVISDGELAAYSLTGKNIVRFLDEVAGHRKPGLRAVGED